MKVLLLLIVLLSNCAEITSPETPKTASDTTTIQKNIVSFPVTYIEWETTTPDDTTWWTFEYDGSLFMAWKRAVTEEYYGSSRITHLPIQYYKGTWTVRKINNVCVLVWAVNRVTPGLYMGVACDLDHPVYVESFYDPLYIAYNFWRTDTLNGYQCDEDAKVLKVKDGDPSTGFSKWNGKHLYERTNPIFKEL
jgi:hypothetical protein